MSLNDKTILITGGHGFLGRHVCKTLKQRGLEIKTTIDSAPSKNSAYIFRSSSFDLCRQDQIQQLLKLKPDIIIHLAAVVGGIGINSQKPGTFYYKNLMMGAMLMEEARLAQVEKVVQISTVCSYPVNTPVPFKESDLWNGFPEITNSAYGIAKKNMLVQSQAYRKEFGFNSIHLIPVNLYGPYDNFDPDTSHVIPALIKKCIHARNNKLDHITCWGTGNATREFLYVEDAAEAIILATERYNLSDPVNIGSGKEISIHSLIQLIADLTNFKGEILFDKTKPDGQPRRCLDTTKAKERFGFEAKTSFMDGLRNTINWYEEHTCQK